MMVTTNQIKKIVFWGFICVAIVYATFTLVRILVMFHLQDFDLYYQGAQSVLGGKNPYTEVQGVIYPPISMILLTPFAAIPYNLTEDVWTVLSFFALLASIFMLIQSTNQQDGLKLFLTMISLAMLSFPVKFTLGMGQINFFLLMFTTLSFYWYRNNKPVLSGAALAIAVALKLSPVVLLLFFIRKRQWRIVASCLFGIIVLNGLGTLLLGTSVTSYYWKEIFPAIPTIGNAVYYNQALTGWLARSQVADQLAGLINYFLLGGMLLLSWLFTKSTKQSAEIELGELGLLVVSILVGTGLAWQHHYVSALIPFYALAFIKARNQRNQVIQNILVGVSFALISMNLKNPSLIQGIWQHLALSHVLFGALLLYGVLLWTLNVSARNKNSG